VIEALVSVLSTFDLNLGEHGAVATETTHANATSREN
jgi:hypothetical protein